MKCKEITTLLDDYILGELSPEFEIQINEHLSECKSCQKELQEKEVAIIAIKKSTVFEPSAESFRRIKRQISIHRKQRRLFWVFPKSFAYAVVAFLFGIGLMKSIDVFILKPAERPRVEIKYETRHEELLVDTVEFYHAPAKNLARI